MDENDIIAFVSDLPGVVVDTATEESGAPEAAWGDTFIFYDPDDSAPTYRRYPFATIVVSDYPGFDTASDLNRPGIFRLNIFVGKSMYEDLVGHPADQHAEHLSEFDFTEVDRILPHPVYGSQAWVSILNPGEATAEKALSLLLHARENAVRRYDRRH
ncbi:hypothetical protein I6N91_00475 [Arthrobacter sp. MSA 4-2]|uniref:DUF6194 family protein n=1 Tax=Arthrobacter sp. MSA 4-2 TaxID=2794349 RepID=UPI0018E820AB|nr:DUF6194 family protein [Arthrobacter sp. MSA 4-2]MBJ2119449.1 hypothetical protein [Arthrobacter sp. MSA 4-2]